VKNPVSDRILGRVPSTLVPVVDFANSICYYPAPYPDRTGWTSRYDGLAGGCMPIVQELNSAERSAMLFVDFNTLVIGHGLDPMTVHRELLKIDEYRRMIPPDHR
jgi:hypothetical protein